jgi:hypothetical protein
VPPRAALLWAVPEVAGSAGDGGIRFRSWT